MLNKKNILGKKAGISYLEMSIMILSSFAVAYLIYETGDVVSAAEVESADLGLSCCEETIDGRTCQSADPSFCKANASMAPTNCGSTEFCKIGCCFSPKTGLCNKRAAKRDCTIMNGTFKENENCNVQECKKGCCIIGDNAMWTTETNCKFEGNTQNKDLVTEWRLDEETNSELKCLFLTEKSKKGACVYDSGDEKKCIYTTLEECVSRTGNENNFDRTEKFCSDPSLNTTCKAKDHKGCIENNEEVYWFDSCGNQESMAEDCSLAGGTYCGEQEEKYICKDINCIIDGKKRKNGESWCEYENLVGFDESASDKDRYGRDTVGSRHTKHICYMGTERIEPCADYRNELCVESVSTTSLGAFSQANCRINNWRTCLAINGKKGEAMERECKRIPDCFLKEIDMDGGFHFKVCLPGYPPGFDLGHDYTTVNGMEVMNSGDAICDIASQQCKETWICGIFGCVCVDSCKCHTCYFTEKMNEFCVSLGDCGGYVNYVGAFTDGGYSVKSTGAAPPRCISESMYTKNVGPHPNQPPAKPGDFEFFETLNPGGLKQMNGTEPDMPANLTPFQSELLGVAGAMGSPYLLKMLENDSEDAAALGASPKAVNYAGFYNGFSSVRSSISSQIVYKDKKAGGFEMIAAMIAALIAFVIFQSILIALLAALLAFLFAMAWIKYVYIDFMCSTWERPSGGTDCNKCNKIEIPCTEYKCQSLGEKCKFVNKGTTNELCITMPPNSSNPVIRPLESEITEGFSYYNIKDNGFEIVKKDNNGCIPAFTTVRFGIKVEPFAKCRFGTDPKQAFEEMPEKFGVKGNAILPVHRMDFFFPSPEAWAHQFNLTEEQKKQISEMKFYVKCKTADGKVNTEAYLIKTCVDPGPDLTAPRITLTNPPNKGFLKYNIDTQEMSLYVNEPADCKWSTSDKAYADMENQMSCSKDLMQYSMFGLPCNTTLTNLKNNTRFYIRCIDMSENKNVMVQSYVYEVYASASPLTIDEMKPAKEEFVIASSEPASFEFRLSTSGGALSGVSSCSWEGEGGYGDLFTETNSTLHSYTITSAKRGRWNIKFICEDVAGNIAENMTSFRVMIDNIGPQVVRVYNFGGLKVVTDEVAEECRYDFSRRFVYENATIMGGGTGLEHSADWQPRVYYIQCRDELGNKGNIIMARPYDVFVM